MARPINIPEPPQYLNRSNGLDAHSSARRPIILLALVSLGTLLILCALGFMVTRLIEPTEVLTVEENKVYHHLVSTEMQAGSDFQHARGFVYPVGSGNPVSHCNDGDGWYVAREFLSKELCGLEPDSSDNHLGEDWNGELGGNSDLGSDILAVSSGAVVYSGTPAECWGRVVIILHSAPEGGGFLLPDGRTVPEVWSMYAHLESVRVGKGDAIETGRRIGTLGADCCTCYAHLHFEIISDPKGPFPGAGYYLGSTCQDRACGRVDPTEFIELNMRVQENL